MAWKLVNSDAPPPKDGTEFLAKTASGLRFICCWRDNPYKNGLSDWGHVIDCTTVWAEEKPIFWMELPE